MGSSVLTSSFLVSTADSSVTSASSTSESKSSTLFLQAFDDFLLAYKAVPIIPPTKTAKPVAIEDIKSNFSFFFFFWSSSSILSKDAFLLSSDVLDGLEDEEAGDDEDEDADADADGDDNDEEEEEDGEDDDDDGECDDEFPTTELLLCTEPISN